MTERLFQQDPYLREFAGKVIRRTTHEGKPAVVLDRTAFYPTSGGQPHDTGTLASARVVDVVEQGAEILHIVDADPGRDDVNGAIDWNRRRDNIQHHHGQHLLSAAFEKNLDADTTSCHLGDGECAIDLDRVVTTAEAEAAEELANRVIWENRPVNISWHTREEVAKLPLRKPPQVDGKIRIVKVEGFDLNPCCGTHPKSTGEVGVVMVLGVERRAKESRVTFVCGTRALAHARRNETLLRSAGVKLSAGRDGLEAAIDRIQSESALARKAVKAAEKRLASLDAAELANGAVTRGGCRFVTKILEGRDLDYLRAVASEITSRPGLVVALGSAGGTSSIVLARSKEVPIDLRPIGQQALAHINGRGGGPPHLVQGGGEGQDLKGALELADRLIAESFKA